MPRTPDASMVTSYRRVNATVTTDPVIKSRTFVAPLKGGVLIATTRSTQEAATISASRSVLSIPAWKSPQFNGRFFVK